MSTFTAIKPQAKAASNFSARTSSLLQRKCACGDPSGLDGMCQECRDKRLQPSSRTGIEPVIGLPIVHALQSPGQPLDGKTQTSMESHFGHDFSKIQVHSPTSTIQAKLIVGRPNDHYEQEADEVANQVIAMPGPENQQSIQRWFLSEDEIRQQSLVTSITPMVQRQETQKEKKDEEKTKNKEKEDEEEETESNGQIAAVQPKLLQRTTKSEFEDYEGLESRLNHSRNSGSPIADEVRSFVEPRMQFDFSSVKVHKDNEANQMNQELGARAFTHGRDIYFGGGQYTPNSVEGKKLIAHELTHVVQQGGVQRSPISPISKSVSSNLVQRVVPIAMGAAEWIAAGAVGYIVAQDAIKASAGDIKYTFDEMEGVLLPGGGNDVAQYRTQHPNTGIRSKTHNIATWLGYEDDRKMGIKFGVTFNYDGHAIGNISCNILDTYDWLFWEGQVNVNFTPQSLASGGVARVRITLDLGADRTFAGGVARSRILELDGTGLLQDKGGGTAWHSFD